MLMLARRSGLVRHRSSGSSVTPIVYDFTQGSLPGGLTLTRASSAYFCNASGVLTSAAANVARFDTNPATLAGRGLLYEPPSTNEVFPSNNFATTWSKNGTAANTTLTANAGTAPDGSSTAQQVTITAAYNGFLQFAANMSSGITYATSVWVKWVSGSFQAAIGNSTFSFTSASAPVASGGTYLVEAFPNGWYRITSTSQSGNTVTFYNDSGSTGTVLVWGYQALAASFDYSYVATTSATVTRSADVLSNLTIPAGYGHLTVTADDGSTQAFAVSPGSYALAASSLARPWIKTMAIGS